MNGWIRKQKNQSMKEWMNQWRNEGIKEMNEWMNEWMNNFFLGNYGPYKKQLNPAITDVKGPSKCIHYTVTSCNNKCQGADK